MDMQEFTLTVALGASTGTQADPVNPLRGTLKKVQVKCANDANVTGMKIELLRYDRLVPGYVAVYTGADQTIADDGVWHDVDGMTDIDISLSFALDGNYTWRITPDAAPAAAMAVKIRRTLGE